MKKRPSRQNPGASSLWLIPVIGILGTVLAVVGWHTMSGIELRVRERLLSSVSAVLTTTQRSLHFWVRPWQTSIASAAASQDLRAAATTLLDSPRKAEALRASPAQAKVQSYFAGLPNRPAELGYF